MTKFELIDRLLKIEGNPEVMVLDGFNGGGYFRTINLGPSEDTITQEHEDMSGDCEGRAGEKIIRMGYGFY